ncbi:Protein GRISEA [Escovopsis weberi]|uniref:Protein GRISEA n=1 Tax=Escovopsis weberi TaxID=150374 RepID=A0A0M8N4U5_ESCWE|nr:Protein GRISEA [Escovopsis weberi]
MPLINGQKMACEPCIRGHRSTKCSHANERLMVPVRRPGRPLSSCPHPPSRPCLCAAAVTAAIPKKQKCRCDTSQPVAANGLEVKTEAAPGADVTPLQASSSKGSETPGHRVQKSVSKSKAGKKPIDPAALERMDASQVNIVSPFDAGLAKSPPPPPQSAATTPGNPGYGVMQFVSPEAASAAPHLSQSIDPGPQNMPVADPTYDHYTAMPMPAMHQMSHMNGTSWTSHQCGCGDSCQCIGCASHPYNEATQNYVRSAWNMMMEESPPQQKPNSHHEADHGTPMNHTSLQNGSSTSTGASMPAVKTSSDDAAPPSSAGRTPTDSAGPASASAGAAYEEQILSANDFFFVSYPFRIRPASQAQL